MKCDNHPDRGGILFVDLPSIGVRRWGCFECRANFDKAMLNSPSPRKEAREGRQPWEKENDYANYMIKRDKETPQWLRELRTGNPGETHGMEGREATHAALTKISRERPNDR